jgi:hypothetical protein
MFHVLGDILLVTSADESRRQIVVCPPVYAAAGLAISPCGVTSADESRRQILVCLPVYAAGLAISPCGAGTRVTKLPTTKKEIAYEVRLPHRVNTVFAHYGTITARKHGGLITYFQINRDYRSALYRIN